MKAQAFPFDTDTNADTLATLVELAHRHTGMAMNAEEGAANDSAFFRTPPVWNYFSTQFLSDWHRDHAGQALRIWSAAAATGEEVYSLAMSCEEFRHHAKDFQYHILATDISADALAQAEEGLYRRRAIATLRETRPGLLEKYFRPHTAGMRVGPGLRRCIRFAQHNLLTPLHDADRFDIVFLRNVLIYFDAQAQDRIVSSVRNLMKDDAKLILGESESLGSLSAMFRCDMPLVYSVN